MYQSPLTLIPATGDSSLLTGGHGVMPNEGQSSSIPAIRVIARVSRAAAICLALCCCQRGGLCAATCGDGIVGENEDCDPPGWASCPGGAACRADCTCP
jgi:hypothetical protein